MQRLMRLVRPLAEQQLAAEDELRPLAESANAGDRIALRTLLSTLTPQTLRIVRRVIGVTHPDVEDVAQECTLELVEALKRFRGESSVQHFACRVVLHTAMNARRRLGARKRALAGEQCCAADEVAAGSPDVESQTAQRAGVVLVRRLCDELPEVQAEALALQLVLGHTIGEIAAISNAPIETVRSRLKAAKSILMQRAQAEPRLRELIEEIA